MVGRGKGTAVVSAEGTVVFFWGSALVVVVFTGLLVVVVGITVVLGLVVVVVVVVVEVEVGIVGWIQLLTPAQTSTSSDTSWTGCSW